MLTCSRLHLPPLHRLVRATSLSPEWYVELLLMWSLWCSIDIWMVLVSLSCAHRQIFIFSCCPPDITQQPLREPVEQRC